MAYAEDLKSRRATSQRDAPKRTVTNIECICRGSPHSRSAAPRTRTHRIENPTDTTTDTSAGVAAAFRPDYRPGPLGEESRS
jgi:hypothetical protein